MSRASEPITVGQLIERLTQIDPSRVVMLDCEDQYYSGPLTLEKLLEGEAGQIDGEWFCCPDAYEGEPLERRPALIIGVNTDP